MANTEKVLQIRRLNDALRRKGQGGRMYLTRGIVALGSETVTRILAAVVAFDDFTPDNDPYGEHDCAALEVEGYRVLWKIDYYNEDMSAGSADPADPSITSRVLTVMLQEEY
ncbi:MAG: DUF3768 domain-containing protein [Rhodovibrionaceae bacterium]